jgi:hypothetical protein
MEVGFQLLAEQFGKWAAFSFTPLAVKYLLTI